MIEIIIEKNYIKKEKKKGHMRFLSFHSSCALIVALAANSGSNVATAIELTSIDAVFNNAALLGCGGGGPAGDVGMPSLTQLDADNDEGILAQGSVVKCEVQK